MPGSPGTALIAYDGSEDAATAIRQAGHLLAPRPAIVAHVWESLAGMLLHRDVAGLTGGIRDAAAELHTEDRRKGEHIAAEGARLAQAAGFKASSRALEGRSKAWPALLAESDAIDAAVIVIGSRGLGYVKSALFGSVSSGLLHHAHRPVLVVPPCDGRLLAGRVLVGFDGSDAAGAAVEAAGGLLVRREVAVGSVWFPYAPMGGVGAPAAPVVVASPRAGEIDQYVAERAARTAADGARQASRSGLEAEGEALRASGPVWATLLDRAGQLGSPAIVVGSRGRGVVAEAVLGSVSSAVVHHADVPVLVVPPPRA